LKAEERTKNLSFEIMPYYATYQLVDVKSRNFEIIKKKNLDKKFKISR